MRLNVANVICNERLMFFSTLVYEVGIFLSAIMFPFKALNQVLKS